MQGMIGAVVELLWWLLFAGLLIALAYRSVRDRWPARRRGRDAAGGVGRLVRKYEEEQLARMKAEGLPIWRPDPAKLKRISERQD